MPIVTFKNLEAVEYKWHSPLSNRLKKRSSEGIVAVQHGSIRPALEILAKGGFHHLAAASIRLLADHVGAVYPEGADLAAVLMAVIKCILPTMPDSEVLDIMSGRNLDDDIELARILSSEVHEVFNKSDAAEIASWAESKLKGEAAIKEYAAKLKSLHEDLAPATKAKHTPKGKAKAAAGASAYPAVHIDDNDLFTEEAARAQLPPHSRILKDTNNKRWLIFYREYSRSRSFKAYGTTRALGLCLSWCWQKHHAAGGPPCPYEWVNNLEASD